jgi:hypothetical protein
MKIADSSLHMSSYSSSLVSDSQSRELQLTAVSDSSLSRNQSLNTLDTIQISSEAAKAYYSRQEAGISGLSVVTSGEGDTAGLQVIRTAENQQMSGSGSSVQTSSETAVSSGSPLSSAWDMEFTSTSVHYESEQLRVSAGGSVTTGDGRKITFDLDLCFSREYASIEQETVSASKTVSVAVTDPLVINFSGGLPGLSATKFAFDMDNDGTNELVSSTATGSGFLALDRNADGRINNGSELFGPATGSGYSELACYDGDQNGWIDENDAVFAKLSIWTKDGAGNDKLLTLKEAGIGAISVNAVSSEFSLTDGSNQLKGQVRSSGVYLTEQGKVGAMQQIDLATEEPPAETSDAKDIGLAEQADELLQGSDFETRTNIRRLAATAAWLANESSKLSRSFRESLARDRSDRKSGRIPDTVEKMLECLGESVKDSFREGREHKRTLHFSGLRPNSAAE